MPNGDRPVVQVRPENVATGRPWVCKAAGLVCADDCPLPWCVEDLADGVLSRGLKPMVKRVVRLARKAGRDPAKDVREAIAVCMVQMTTEPEFSQVVRKVDEVPYFTRKPVGFVEVLAAHPEPVIKVRY